MASGFRSALFLLGIGDGEATAVVDLDAAARTGIGKRHRDKPRRFSEDEYRRQEEQHARARRERDEKEQRVKEAQIEAERIAAEEVAAAEAERVAQAAVTAEATERVKTDIGAVMAHTGASVISDLARRAQAAEAENDRLLEADEMQFFMKILAAAS